MQSVNGTQKPSVSLTRLGGPDMEVHKDFSKRMTALAEGIPREVIGALIRKLLPKEPVSVRAPEGGWKSADATTGEPQPRGFRSFKGRRRSVKVGSYKVLN